MKIGLFVLVLTLQLITVLVCPQYSAIAGANITNEEFLQLYFELSLHQHGPRDFNIIKFHPIAGPSDENALLFIIQVIDDNTESRQNPGLQSIIRLKGGALLMGFESCFKKLPTLQKRWPLIKSEANLIIRYVRYSDSSDTLAVTIDGVTYFNPEDFKRAEQRLKKVGGFWGSRR
jgi:hypothetical protein